MPKANNTERKTKEIPSVKNVEERVEVTPPRGSQNDDPNFYISVNGVNYILPRGKKSLVPPAVAYEYYRSLAAQEALDKRMQDMIDASNI